MSWNSTVLYFATLRPHFPFYLVTDLAWFEHKNHLVRVRRRSCFGLKYPRWLPRTQLEVLQGVLKNSWVCATSAAGNCPEVSSKTPRGFTLTNVELRSLARQPLISVTPPPSTPSIPRYERYERWKAHMVGIAKQWHEQMLNLNSQLII